MARPDSLDFSDRSLLLLILPVAGELALHYSVGLVDSVMVSDVGEAAVSGVSLMNFVVSFFNSLLTALALGGGVLAGQHLGNSQRREAASASRQAILLLAATGAATALAACTLQPFVIESLFGNLAPDVRLQASRYYPLAAASLPFMGVYSAAAAVFRAYGNTALPLRIMIVANILNIGGNAMAVYALEAGVGGVAISTLASRALAAAAITALLLPKIRTAGATRGLRPRYSTLRKIASLGLPYSFENGMFYLGRVLVLIIVASFGTASIAANAVGQAITLFQVLPGMAAVTGITVVVARCAGAGDYAKAARYGKRVAAGIYLFHIASCAIVCALLPLVMRLYSLSPEATGLVWKIVTLNAAFTIAVWPASYALPAIFRAAGDTRYPMAVSVACMVVCRVGLSYLLGVGLGMGLVGVWLGMFGDWIAKGAIFLFRFRGRKWRRFRLVG